MSVWMLKGRYSLRQILLQGILKSFKFNNYTRKEAVGFWWTPVKLRRPFILGDAILEYNERNLNEIKSCGDVYKEIKSSIVPNYSSFFWCTIGSFYKRKINMYIIVIILNIPSLIIGGSSSLTNSSFTSKTFLYSKTNWS